MIVLVIRPLLISAAGFISCYNTSERLTELSCCIVGNVGGLVWKTKHLLQHLDLF